MTSEIIQSEQVSQSYLLRCKHLTPAGLVNHRVNGEAVVNVDEERFPLDNYYMSHVKNVILRPSKMDDIHLVF